MNELKESQQPVVSRPTVYVTQITSRRDKETGAVVPIYNVSPASEHGAIKVLMPSGVNFYATADLVRQAKDSLKDYSYENGDCIICIGDPAIIAVCIAVVARKNSKFSILKWDRIVSRYVKIDVSI